MGGRPDHLHTPGMGLVIGPRALEAGQERVMNVDAATGQAARQLVRQDLHVARQHDQFGPGLLDQLPQLGLLPWFGLRRDWQMREGDALQIGVRKGRGWVIGDHAGERHRQFALAPAPDQVRQAVIGL